VENQPSDVTRTVGPTRWEVLKPTPLLSETQRSPLMAIPTMSALPSPVTSPTHTRGCDVLLNQSSPGLKTEPQVQPVDAKLGVSCGYQANEAVVPDPVASASWMSPFGAKPRMSALPLGSPSTLATKMRCCWLRSK